MEIVPVALLGIIVIGLTYFSTYKNFKRDKEQNSSDLKYRKHISKMGTNKK